MTVAFELSATVVVSGEYHVFEGTPEEIAEFEAFLEDWEWQKALWEYIDPQEEPR